MTPPSSAEKRRPWAEAWALANSLKDLLSPACSRIEIAGSVRRRKPTVKDIEIVYVAKTGTVSLPGEMFPVEANLVDVALDELIRTGVFAKRLNVNGTPAYGEWNKLMVHAPTGIAVDLFATTERAWWSYLVCRTGGAESNTNLAGAAHRQGLDWHPYEGGFSPRGSGICTIWPSSEEQVFKIAGMPYLPPENRT